jgi:hypothetical protein
MSEPRFDRSLKRNLDELGRAILDWKAIKGLEVADTAHPIDFIRLSYWALFNDCFAHAMRVFEHGRVASFWYLRSCKEAELDQAAAVGIEITELERLSASLKLVRNKTHFHIDQKAVFDPRAVWQRADIKGPDFERLLRGSFDILNKLHRKRWGHDFWLPEYDGADACAIAKFSESLRDSKPRRFEAEAGA